MKNKTLLIAIAIVALIASTIACSFDPSVKRYGFLMAAGMIISMAVLLFLVITINYFALAFCIRQIRKLFGKNKQQ